MPIATRRLRRWCQPYANPTIRSCLTPEEPEDAPTATPVPAVCETDDPELPEMPDDPVSVPGILLALASPAGGAPSFQEEPEPYVPFPEALERTELPQTLLH